MEMTNLRDLLVDDLKDLLHAENQLVKALPKMAKKASNEELSQAFEEHLEQTKEHVQRLEQVMQILGVPARTKTCKAMQGIIEEGKELMEEDAEPEVLDAGLIGAAQKVEHYEIASYGTVAAYAKLLGNQEAAQLLSQTLQEEKQTDEKLTNLAERLVNVEAAEGEA